MHVTVVYVKVKELHIEDFIQACEANHLASVAEPGNRCFDVLQKSDEPSSFVLYEAYDSEAAARAHKETPHYLAWRETVADWMAEPRQGIAYRGLFPHA